MPERARRGVREFSPDSPWLQAQRVKMGTAHAESRPEENMKITAELASVGTILALSAGCAGAQRHSAAVPTAQRAIVISIDGMHAVDLALYVNAHPDSSFAELARRGVTYANARQPLVGDSSPGVLSFRPVRSPSLNGI